MRPLRVLETVLYARELDDVEEFYAGVLGLELFSKEEGRYLFFRCGEAMLLVFDPEATGVQKGPVPSHGARGPGHLAFAAGDDELDAWRSRLEERGVKIESEVEWPGGGRSIYFRDPAENSLELTTPRIWSL